MKLETTERCFIMISCIHQASAERDTSSPGKDSIHKADFSSGLGRDAWQTAMLRRPSSTIAMRSISKEHVRKRSRAFAFSGACDCISCAPLALHFPSCLAFSIPSLPLLKRTSLSATAFSSNLTYCDALAWTAPAMSTCCSFRLRRRIFSSCFVLHSARLAALQASRMHPQELDHGLKQDSGTLLTEPIPSVHASSLEHRFA